MSTDFDRLSSSKHAWQVGEDLASHTLLKDRAERTVRAYVRLLLEVAGPQALVGSAIELGAGAGFATAAFRVAGVDMIASEHTEEGLALLGRMNPSLPLRLDSVTTFYEPERYSLLVARELYPFTRINAFTEQAACIGRLIDSLVPGGALLLVESDVSAPHCLDMRLLKRTLQTDARVARVSGPWLEALQLHGGAMMGNQLCRMLVHAVMAPYVRWRKSRGWAAIGVLVIVKR